MKKLLRIALAPVMLILRLILGLTAFVTSIASSVIGLCTSVFAILSVIEFCIGYWENGIAFAVFTLLASPIGLPMISSFLLNRIDHVLYMFENLLC